MEGKILIVGTNMMNIFHHRLELIKALLSKGFETIVAAPEGGEVKALKETGCRFIHLPVDNRGTNVRNDLSLIRNLRKIYRKERPDIILTFYTKTNIYGCLVARAMKIPYVTNITGLGSSLIKGEGSLYKALAFLYKNAIKKARLLYFQNSSNRDFFLSRNLYRGKYRMLPGSGVSLERYFPLPYPDSDTTEFLFASRVLKDKGIEEYLEAAEIVKKKYPEVKFHVVGPCDPSCKSLIEEAENKGLIENHGKIYDLRKIFAETHCTVHPSYHEGMANVLLESAASARPIITSDAPGCRETVENGVTGFMVKKGDGKELADAMERFLRLNADERIKMGEKGREKMEREFDRRIVTDEYLDIIGHIMNEIKK